MAGVDVADRNRLPAGASAPLVPSRFERPIYLDHHATTPVDPRVARVVLEAMIEAYGNAGSSDHAYGEEAAGLLEDARAGVAHLVGAEPRHVRFTSGASDAIRLALGLACARLGGAPLRVVACRAEHAALLEPLQALERDGRARLAWIDVDAKGRVSLAVVREALGQGADLLCLMAANNETGTVYPTEEAASLAHAHGAEVLVDATQAAGRVALRATVWGLDYLVLSAHKLYGPKGVGALVGPDALSSAADAVRGHEGTANVPGAVGMAAACRLFVTNGSEDQAYVAALRDRLEAALLAGIPGLVVNGDRASRLAHSLHVSAPGAPNDAVVALLQRRVAISTGSACSSGAPGPSHVLRAMRLAPELQESALRISPGRFNTAGEIDRAAEAIIDAVAQVRASMRYC